MVMRRALLALTGLLVMLGASRVQSAWATRQLAREGAMLQQTVMLHCRHSLAPALKAGSREGYAERFAGCADFAVTAAAIHGGLLGAMMLQVEVAPGPQFPLPVRRFVFKAGPLTDKGLLALGAASIGQLRFNPAVAYSAFSFRSAF